jgi:hypothetical protein
MTKYLIYYIRNEREIFCFSVCSLSISSILTRVCELSELVLLITCDLFYEDSERLFLFQNTHVEAVHVDQFSNMCGKLKLTR